MASLAQTNDWLQPQTEKVLHERFYVERLPGSNVFIGAGYYIAIWAPIARETRL